VAQRSLHEVFVHAVGSSDVSLDEAGALP
jgi:hypothetical protein